MGNLSAPQQINGKNSQTVPIGPYGRSVDYWFDPKHVGFFDARPTAGRACPGNTPLRQHPSPRARAPVSSHAAHAAPGYRNEKMKLTLTRIHGQACARTNEILTGPGEDLPHLL